jgi:hypothetical protein
MNARLRDILEQLERATAAIDFLLPLPSVHHPRMCKCGDSRFLPTFYSEQIGAEICGDCGGLIIVDSDEVSK